MSAGFGVMLSFLFLLSFFSWSILPGVYQHYAYSFQKSNLWFFQSSLLYFFPHIINFALFIFFLSLGLISISFSDLLKKVFFSFPTHAFIKQ